MESGQKGKWSKWKVVKKKSGKNEKQIQVVKMKSGQHEKWSKWKLVKMESGQMERGQN